MSNEKVIEKLKNDPLMPIRHTTEHVRQAAMRELYPEIKLVMGPPIEDGFYFDFDLETRITPEDFPKIEAKMKELIAGNLSVTMKELSEKESSEVFVDNEYKQNTLDEIVERKEKITVCIIGEENTPKDIDLCMGYHTEKTGNIKSFKLLSVAGAYYKGDEKNKMLQRIYGTAFNTQKELDEYIKAVELKKENDHRKLNQVLDIFATSDLVGKGLIMYTPNGTVIRNERRDQLLKV